STRQEALAALRERAAADSTKFPATAIAALSEIATGAREDAGLRCEALDALNNLERNASEVVPSLLPGLSDKNNQVRLHTACTLSSIPAKRDALFVTLAALARAGRDATDPVGALAAEALEFDVSDALSESESLSAQQLERLTTLTRTARDFIERYGGPTAV